VCKAAVGCIVSQVEWRLEVGVVNGTVVNPGSEVSGLGILTEEACLVL